jgi:hypothetical protein
LSSTAYTKLDALTLQRQAPLAIVMALVAGCAFGSIVKPNLAAIVVGAGAAGLVVAITRH